MKTVVIISANAEWRSVKSLYPAAQIQTSQLGEWLVAENLSTPVIFFHGGWGKISAAATAQYVIEHFQPHMLINLGTCGGFEGCIKTGTVILVEKTIVYDIFEQMSDADDAIAHYSTDIELTWLANPLPYPVERGLLVSGDRDILVDDIPMLINRFNAVAADWESGAIAWVANKNHMRCLILRGVSDLVGSGGGEAYGNLDLFQQRSDEIMKQLVYQLGDWIQAAGG
jgi:adenosylhomocysteine nucleosidase